MLINDTTSDRFWSKVDTSNPSGCWMWSAAKSRYGYGYFGIDGKCRLAHRVSVMLDGRDPVGKVVMHTCDTPACVNPAHLQIGTHADNVHDKIAKGRERSARGENAGNAKLTDDQYLYIAARYFNGERAVVLAHQFGIDRRTVTLIANRIEKASEDAIRQRRGIREPLRVVS